jgi:hypothetical protein
MSERVEQISKPELLKRIYSQRKCLEDSLALLSNEQLVQPGVEGEWSVKDILAHMTAWEKRMIRWVGETLRGQVPEMPAKGMTWDDLDQLNERTYLENRDRPLAEVLADFHHSYQEVLAVVEAIPEEDMVDPNRFEWRAGTPLWKMLAANTWWHYRMHDETIRSWLENLPAT